MAFAPLRWELMNIYEPARAQRHILINIQPILYFIKSLVAINKNLAQKLFSLVVLVMV